MSAKLIIVEGLPGSGKSTTAQIVYDILLDKGIDVELFSEGNYNHPADYEGAAYFKERDFELLQQVHSESIDMLGKIKIKYHGGYLIFYRKAMQEQQVHFDDKLFQDIIKNDIYELPIDIHTELIFNRWNDFVEHYINKDKVIIFECCFIQNPVTVTMIRSNSQKQVTMNYVHRLAEIIKPLEPILLYVEQGDIKKSFTKAVTERPKEWLEGFTSYYIGQGYGVHNNLTGLEGVIKVLEERAKLEQEIYNSLELNKYKIDNSLFDPDLHKNGIKSIIERHL